MTVIEALERIKGEVLERRENVWNRHVDRSSELNHLISSANKNGRLDAYEGIAEFIDKVCDEILEAEEQHEELERLAIERNLE